MEKRNHSRIGITSFVLSIIPIIYIIIQSIVDIYFPINTEFNKVAALTYIIMNFMFAVFLVSFMLAIIAIRQKGYKKILPIISLIISGLILLIPIITSIKLIIQILNM